jgi:hypothetical protein
MEFALVLVFMLVFGAGLFAWVMLSGKKDKKQNVHR